MKEIKIIQMGPAKAVLNETMGVYYVKIPALEASLNCHIIYPSRDKRGAEILCAELNARYFKEGEK